MRRRIAPWLLLTSDLCSDDLRLRFAAAGVLPNTASIDFERGQLIEDFSFDAYVSFLTDPYFHTIVLNTLRMASITTICSVLVGYPLNYCVVATDRPVRAAPG